MFLLIVPHERKHVIPTGVVAIRAARMATTKRRDRGKIYPSRTA